MDTIINETSFGIVTWPWLGCPVYRSGAEAGQSLSEHSSVANWPSRQKQHLVGADSESNKLIASFPAEHTV